MMVCPACNGEGKVKSEDRHWLALDYVNCSQCECSKFVPPPQQILDDLECAEIEAYLIKKSRFSYIKQKNGVFKLMVTNKSGYSKPFKFNLWSDKLEALRKSKAWLDGRCAE